MKSFPGKASLIVTLVAALVGANGVQTVEIKIGVALLLSGALSGYGQPSQKGLNIIQAITPTLKNGDTIGSIIVGDKNSRVEAADTVQRLVSDNKVDTVIGEVISSNVLAMTKTADDSKAPLASSTVINDRATRNHSYVSRVCFLDSFQGVVGTNLASRSLKAETAAIVFDSSNDYSVGLAKAFRTQSLKNGDTIPIEVQVPGGSKDLKAQPASVEAKNVDMTYMPIHYIEGVLTAVQSKQLGLNKPVVSDDGLAADQVFFGVGRDAIDSYMTTDYYPPNAKEQTPAGETFIKAWEAEYQQPIYTRGIMATDAYNAIVNAANQCNDPYDRICVNEKIRVTKGFQGMTGALTLQNGDAIRNAIINEVKDDKLAFRTVVSP